MRILFILLIAIINWNIAISQSLEQQFQKVIDDVYTENPDRQIKMIMVKQKPRK